MVLLMMMESQLQNGETEVVFPIVKSQLSKCSHRGGYLTMMKFHPPSDARIFFQIKENMSPSGGNVTRLEFSFTFRPAYLIAKQVLLMKSKLL